MPPDWVVLALLFFAAALLYASVGHAGASAYLAAMSLLGIAPDVMRPTALVLNLFVASIVIVRFHRAGALPWRQLLPLALGSVPAAFVGGTIDLPGAVYRPLVALVLLVGAWRLATARVSAIGEEARDGVPFGWGILAGAGIGLLAGLSGTGGGIFLTPLLVLAGGIRDARGSRPVWRIHPRQLGGRDRGPTDRRRLAAGRAARLGWRRRCGRPHRFVARCGTLLDPSAATRPGTGARHRCGEARCLPVMRGVSRRVLMAWPERRCEEQPPNRVSSSRCALPAMAARAAGSRSGSSRPLPCSWRTTSCTSSSSARAGGWRTSCAPRATPTGQWHPPSCWPAPPAWRSPGPRGSVASPRRFAAARPSGWAGVGSRAALLGLWLRLLAVVAAAFVVQESAEHFVSHNHVPLLGALIGPEYPLALPVLAVITLLGATITTLVREREAELLALVAERIAPSRAEAREPRPRPAPRVGRRAAVLATPDLGRAPPRLVVHV